MEKRPCINMMTIDTQNNMERDEISQIQGRKDPYITLKGLVEKDPQSEGSTTQQQTRQISATVSVEQSPSAFRLRFYQDLIAAQATKTNTIAYLPTGSGKTFIAYRVIEYRLQFVRVSRNNPSAWPRIIIFIAPKRALLHQQIQSIRKFCVGVKAEEFGGSTLFNNKKLDQWGIEEWRHHLHNYEVLGMTPASLQTLLEKKLLPSNTIDLLVLDECHHASGHDPMAKLCDALKLSGHTPLILGLTASPVKSKRVQIRKAIEMLEERTMCTFFLPSEKFTQSLRQFAFKTPVIVTSYDDISKHIARNRETSKSGSGDCSFGLKNDDTSMKVNGTNYNSFAIDETFSSVLRSIDNLYARVVCINYIQQLHDSDVLLHRRAFTLLCEKLNSPIAQLSHFVGIKHIRECLRQLHDSTVSCGIFFGFQTILFFLERIVSGLNRSSAESDSCDPFLETLQNKDVEEEEVEEEDDVNESFCKQDEDDTDSDSDTDVDMPLRKKKKANDFQEKEDKPQTLVDDKDVIMYENIVEDIFMPENMTEKKNHFPSFFTNETQELDNITDHIGNHVSSTGNSCEGDLDWSLVDIPETNYLDDDNVNTIDGCNEDNDSIPLRKPLKRKLKYHSYHTFDLDQMKRNTPFIFKHVRKDANYYQFLLNQLNCGIVTMLQTIQQLSLLCDESVMQTVIKKYSLKLAQRVNNDSKNDSGSAIDIDKEKQAEEEINEPKSILLHMLQESLKKNILSWQEINEKLKLFSHQEVVRDAIFIVQLVLQHIPLFQLENVTFHRRKTEVKDSSPQEVVASINMDESTASLDMDNKTMDSPCMKCYFFPKVARLFSLLWAIWRRGEKDTNDNLQDELYYEFIDDEAYLKKIDHESWLMRLQLALQPTTANPAGTATTITTSESLNSPFTPEASTESSHKRDKSNNLPDSEEAKHADKTSMPSTIVFCNRKVTAWALNHIFCRLWSNENLLNMANNKVSPDAEERKITVRSNVLTGDIAVDKQRAVLQQFRDDHIQVLFATEVAEEGLDIKQCASIVNFDQPGTVKAFIQRRGRARAQNSLNINLWPSMATNEINFNSLYRDMRNFLRTERRFDSHFISYTKKLFEATSTDDTEKYSVTSTGAYVDCVSAQALVFEYCQLLLQRRGLLFKKNDSSANDVIVEGDDLGGTLPFYTFESYVDPILDEKVYVTTLHLPTAVNAPPFAWTTSKKHQGKGRAALEAVKFLHKQGVLDDHLRVLGNLREVSPYELLMRNAKRNKNLILESNLEQGDTTEGKVDLIVKSVPDMLTLVPVLKQDRDHAKASTSLLHFYGIRIHIDLQTTTSIGANSSWQHPHIVTYEALNALQGLAFAVPTLLSDCSVNDLEMKWKASFRELTEDKLSWSFYYLGARQVTLQEIGMMQAFHMSILNMQVPELPAQQRDQYGFFPCDKRFWQTYFAQIKEDDGVMASMPYFTPEEWMRSSNQAWYVIAPVHITFDIVCRKKDTENGSDEPWLSTSELFETAASAVAWMNNLHVVRNILASPTGQTLDIVSDLRIEGEQGLEDFIFTSNGRNLIHLDPFLPCTTGLMDIMDTKTNISFVKYFQKRGPHSQKHLKSLLDEQEDVATEAKRKMVCMKTISNKLTFWNLINKATELPEINARNANTRKSFTVRAHSQCMLPSLCWKIGYIHYYYQSMLLPSVAYRFLSLCLASELRMLVQTRWSPVRISRKMLQSHVSHGKDDSTHQNAAITDSKEMNTTYYLENINNTSNVTTTIDSLTLSDMATDEGSLLPSVASILEAMTSSRAHECLASERLEFLGDAFLKMAATLEAYVKYPDAAEGELTVRCKYVICNRSLAKLAESQDIARYLRVFPMSRGLEEVYFRPPGLVDVVQMSMEKEIIETSTSDTMAMDNGETVLEGEIRKTKVSTKRASSSQLMWLPCLRNSNLHMPRASIVDSNNAHNDKITAADTPAVLTEEDCIVRAFQPEHIPRNQCQLARQLPSKVLADIMEALLGACVNQTPLSQGLEAASMMAKSTKILEKDYVFLLSHVSLADRYKMFHFPTERSLNNLLVPHPNQLQYTELASMENNEDAEVQNNTEDNNLKNEDSDAKTTTEDPILTGKVNEIDRLKVVRELDIKDNMLEEDVVIFNSTVVSEKPIVNSVIDLSCSFRRHALPLATSNLQHLQTALQYTFHCPELLGVAFTHASMSFEFLSYDRLEFLGDAVLDFIVAKKLFDMHPNWEEGHLSQSKHAHTNNNYLSKIGARLQVLLYVRHNSSAILRILPMLYQRTNEGNDKEIETGLDDKDMSLWKNIQENKYNNIEEEKYQSRGIQETNTTSTTVDDDDFKIPSAKHHDPEIEDKLFSTDSLLSFASVATITTTDIVGPVEVTVNESVDKKQRERKAENKEIKEIVELEDVELPESIVKIQADIVEAIVGAVYLDSGGDLSQVAQMLSHLGLFAESMSIKPVFVSTTAAVATTIEKTETKATEKKENKASKNDHKKRSKSNSDNPATADVNSMVNSSIEIKKVESTENIDNTNNANSDDNIYGSSSCFNQMIVDGNNELNAVQKITPSIAVYTSSSHVASAENGVPSITTTFLDSSRKDAASLHKRSVTISNEEDMVATKRPKFA